LKNSNPKQKFMGNTKKVIYTVAIGFATGAVIGMLYAPDRGVELRRKIRRLKQKFFCCCNDEIENYDRETLEDLRISLKEQLDIINDRLEQDAG